jgi:hypothetical protein
MNPCNPRLSLVGIGLMVCVIVPAMPIETNPYAAPRADVNAGAGGPYAAQGEYWRSGQILMARHGAVLPARCVKCNGEVEGSLKKQRFYWHHQAWFALVLANVFIYLVVSMIVRRHADVSYGLCTNHRRQRRRAVLLGVGGMFIFLVLVFVGIAADLVVLSLVAFLGIVVSIVVGIVKGRALLPVRIDKSRLAQFKGCGESFLANLPSS